MAEQINDIYTSGMDGSDTSIDETTNLVANVETDFYENAIDSCGFGIFHYIVLLVSGLALASDSVEMQVIVNFFLCEHRINFIYFM